MPEVLFNTDIGRIIQVIYQPVFDTVLDSVFSFISGGVFGLIILNPIRKD